MNSIAMQRAQAALARQDYDKQVLAQGGGASHDFSNAGPPTWDRGAWEAFKAQYGRYPYGHDGQGGYITPPFDGNQPDWVYELIGQRVPPIKQGGSR